MGEVDTSDEFDRSFLFSFLKFHGAGVSQQVTKALIQNGAEECRFMSDDVTHIIIGTHMHKDPNVVGLSELYSQAVLVDESWAISSIMLQKILSPRLFAPKAMAFFEGLIVSFSGISSEDRRKLWFVMSHFGALCLIVLDSRCNLLIAGQPQGLKYNKALKMPSKISIVSPDWVTACLTTGDFVPTESYHPKNTIISDEYEEAVVKQDVKPPEEPPNLTIGLCAPLKDPSILQFSTDNTKNRLSIRKNNSKFVKANIQFFHSGHGAPPALADREKRKEKSMNSCPKTNAVPKSPVASSVESVTIKSEPSPALVKDLNKPKRIIRLTRKRPLHFQHEPKPEKRLYNFLQLNETIDNRVPKECCARGCRFLVNDVKKFISSDLSSALKEFLSGKSFDCSCPCHFFSTSLINEINCQGAWLDAESNPRIRALLDLQRLVSSVPRNYQTEFLQSTFYSPTESVFNAPNQNQGTESTNTERCVSSLSEKCSKPAEESSERRSVQEDHLSQCQSAPQQVLPGTSSTNMKSTSESLNVIVTLHSDGTASSKSASKVNPALNALYSKYTSEIVQIDDKRIVLKFKRVKCKSEYDEKLIKQELDANNFESLDSSKMRDINQIRTPGATVDVYWDEKQLKGTEFTAGWYTSIVSSYKVESDQIVIQDLFTPSKTFKIPVAQLLAEDKLRLSKSFLPSTAVVPSESSCSNPSFADQISSTEPCITSPVINAFPTAEPNSEGTRLMEENRNNSGSLDSSSKLHVDCSMTGLNSEHCSYMGVETNSGQISPAAFVNLPSDAPRTKKWPSSNINTNSNLSQVSQQPAQQTLNMVNLPSPGNIFNNFDINCSTSSGNSAMLSSLHNQSTSMHLSDNYTDCNNQVNVNLNLNSSSLLNPCDDVESSALKSALRTGEDPPISRVATSCSDMSTSYPGNSVVDTMLYSDQQHTTPSVCSDYFSEGGLDEICLSSMATTNLSQPQTQQMVHQTANNSTYKQHFMSASSLPSSSATMTPSPMTSNTFSLSYHHHQCDQQSADLISNSGSKNNSRSNVQYYHHQSLAANEKWKREDLKKSVEFDDLSSDEEVEKSNDESGVENDQEFITKSALNILDNLKMFWPTSFDPKV